MNTERPHDIKSPQELLAMPEHEQRNYNPITGDEARHLADKDEAYRAAWLRAPMRTRLRLLASDRELRNPLPPIVEPAPSDPPTPPPVDSQRLRTAFDALRSLFRLPWESR